MKERLTQLVLLPYEITLFSNLSSIMPRIIKSFTTLWNYTILKLVTRLLRESLRFTTLWNYTILKLEHDGVQYSEGFTTLWNYTILKRAVAHSHQSTCFTTLWNYTILKLPLSRTAKRNRFTTLWNYTILKPNAFKKRAAKTFQRYDEVTAELFDYYQQYGTCLVGSEYTNPSNLITIMNTIKSGRADTTKDAINLLLEDTYRNNMQRIAAQAARSAAAAARGARVGAVFSAANFFLK